MEKIKNLLGGSLLCAVPRKGEGVYAARRPFVNVTNITHTNETIYYILHYEHTQKQGKVDKILLLVRMCVRVLSCETATPLLEFTLIFPLFTTVTPFLCPSRVRVCVCIVWRCSGGMCLCVGASSVCVYFPPCARWCTTHKHPFCPCLP